MSPPSSENILYLAHLGHEAELAAELGAAAGPLTPGNRLYASPGPARDVAWAATTWLKPQRIAVTTIPEAVATLRGLARSWAYLPTLDDRMARGIHALIPKCSTAPVAFPPKELPRPEHSAWTLVEPGILLVSAQCSNPFPHGEARFIENHDDPPSRAYLKLWEAFSLAGRWPKPGDRCVDLGSSPGGWTWALERLGARITSVDKAPIDPRLTRLTRVRHLQESAFALDPAPLGRVDWVVSDVICFPERIVRLVEHWLTVHPSANFVVTIKFKGKTDMPALEPLRKVPGSRLVHLHHNKHELTWLRLRPE